MNIDDIMIQYFYELRQGYINYAKKLSNDKLVDLIIKYGEALNDVVDDHKFKAYDIDKVARISGLKLTPEQRTALINVWSFYMTTTEDPFGDDEYEIDFESD